MSFTYFTSAEPGRCVSPQKPHHHRALLSEGFPLPRAGKDHNPTVTVGREHTGIWQRGHSTVEWRPTPLSLPRGANLANMSAGRPWAGQTMTAGAAVSSKGFGALPNGYYQSTQWHGQPGPPARCVGAQAGRHFCC